LTVVSPTSSCTSSAAGEAVINIGSTSDIDDQGWQGGLVSSQVTELTRCGTADWPWLIEAGDGQRINVTLYDFSHEALATTTASVNSPARSFWYSLDSANSPSSSLSSVGGPVSVNSRGTLLKDGAGGTCKVYATIRDGSGSRSTTICGGRAPVTHVFLSSTSGVEIRLLQPVAAKVNSKVKAKVKADPMSSDGEMPYFLLRYEGF